jgi:hypothetical protein
VGFEPTIPAFERAKIVHALDSAATVIGRQQAEVIQNHESANVRDNGNGEARLAAVKRTIVQVTKQPL